MPNFPVVVIETGNALPAPTANLGSGFSEMGAFIRGLFPQGAPADLGKVGATTGGLTITLNPATVFGVYIRNVGANPVQVTWTPTAGASAIVQVLAPGGFIVFANPQNSAAVVTATPGITAVTLTALTATTNCEFVTIG